ncbi:hypothetical protein B0H10DRAFT_2224559 [Mycena sp. CBHHK59/15]|nr:hypothetical protein B0H10DRAFT_2224559 [Mycena sp. CBHHK59/15]
MSGGRRSLAHPHNPAQGTAFHGLVVAPTFTPDLARPYNIPGTDIVLNSHAPGGGSMPQDTHSSSTPSSEVEDDTPFENQVPETAVGPRLQYVHVTVEWMERNKNPRSNARPKKQHESKFVSRAVEVLSMSRVEFIPIALSAHDYENKYVAGIANGPLMRVSWSGSPYIPSSPPLIFSNMYSGGKTGAAVISNEANWKIIIVKFRDTLKIAPKLDTVCVAFDLDGMEGFLSRSKRLHSPGPDPYETELAFGTRVPNTENFSPAQIAVASAVDEIKSAHSCAEHGTCFINGDLQHLEMNRFRLNMWGQAVVAGKCKAEAPPPPELLTIWTGSTSASTSKPRGRSGPFPAHPPAPSSSSDTTNLLLTSMVPVMAMMAQNMASNIPRAAIPAPAILPAPRSPMQASSPPPAVEDELDVFMDAFCRAKNIPDVTINKAKDQLHESRFTPDILCESSVTTERLQELTGLAEGEVHQLKKFARQWTGKVEGKRARRGIAF